MILDLRKRIVSVSTLIDLVKVHHKVFISLADDYKQKDWIRATKKDLIEVLKRKHLFHNYLIGEEENSYTNLYIY
jgi:hypothetical protein